MSLDVPLADGRQFPADLRDALVVEVLPLLAELIPEDGDKFVLLILRSHLRHHGDHERGQRDE
jgi:hypothetical protein